MLGDLDKRDTLLLKGLAISAIVFHNFFHLVCPAHQNEFSFNPARFWVFLKTVNSPVSAIESFFAFFGHFGVELFVFLAAYGLAKSHWSDPAPWGRFMWERIAKLYPVFGLVVLPWFVVMAFHFGLAEMIRADGGKLLWMFAGISDLIPGYRLPPIGPWWFIPFIVQFYALWPVLRWFTNRFGQRGLLVLAASCLVLVLAADRSLACWSMSLLDTPLGHMPEFCLGIAAARFRMRLHPEVVAASAAALLLGSMYRMMWPLTYISALIVSLAIYLWLRPLLRNFQILARIGEYSLLIFLVNGVVRIQFLDDATSPGAALFSCCLCAAVSFAVAAIVQEFLLPPGIADKFKLASCAANDAEDLTLALDRWVATLAAAGPSQPASHTGAPGLFPTK